MLMLLSLRQQGKFLVEPLSETIWVEYSYHPSVNKKCATVEEAEAEACYEGIKQAAEWIKNNSYN